MQNSVNNQYLSEEWIALVKEAMSSNVTKEGFKQFLYERLEERFKDNQQDARNKT
ncbi:anti-repressor SinI family protein [Alkalihalobacillus macyae]|uniref:anti-repressor SinI family protein n=1 Tax=Guptibacillus hwajinpoensis TaxID=208199 RepID=UPI00273C06DA|nr:anti-repressor SinI family protein [Alkalihalobacillus macyae]MDP4551147.1 anti-repressor SinI family protein [Alkalihalobacillus macyae]